MWVLSSIKVVCTQMDGGLYTMIQVNLFIWYSLEESTVFLPGSKKMRKSIMVSKEAQIYITPTEDLPFFTKPCAYTLLCSLA